jgi:hypothetical protein
LKAILRALAARVRARVRHAQARPLAVSLLLHAVAILVGGSAVLVQQSGSRQAEFKVEPGGLLVDETPPAAAPPAAEAGPSRTFQPSPAGTPSTVRMLVTNALLPERFRTESAAPRPDAAPDSPNAARKPLGLSTQYLPPSMAGRIGADARRAAWLRNGGSERTEAGALGGLRWFMRAQNRDGSWGNHYIPALTGLVLLCYLGHGELPDSPEFGPTVERGFEWLRVNGTNHRGRLCMHGYFDQQGVYEHAIGTYVLGEYYTMTRDERVRNLLGWAATYIVQGQAPDGGWQYTYSKGGPSDTSVSGWQIQALKAVYLAGLTGLGVEQALDKSTANLQRVRSDDGSFGYRKAGDRDGYGLTGVGALCAYLRWSKPEPLLLDGVRYILDRTEKDQPVQYRADTANLYAWYYNTQACLMAGGDAWQRWNGWMQPELLGNQSADGSFPPTGNPRSFGPEQSRSRDGQIYRTALCVLMLEAYYRHLPSSK